MSFTYTLGAPQVRQKRSLKFEIEGEQDDESERWMTWGGDKDPNDFMDWNVDSEGNFFMDIPLKQTEVKSNDEEFAQANKTEVSEKSGLYVGKYLRGYLEKVIPIVISSMMLN